MKRFTLCILLLLILTLPVYANITIDGRNVHIDTAAYSVRFDEGVITYIHNKRTNETYTIPESNGIQGKTGILRWDRGPIPIWVRESVFESSQLNQDTATLIFRQGNDKIVLTIEIESVTEDLLITGHAESDKLDVYGLQWGFDNIDINNVDIILPANGGQVITASRPLSPEYLFEQEGHGYTYPESWQAQLAIGQGEQGGFFVRATDETFRHKRLHYNKNSEELTLGFQTHNQGPFDTLTTAQSVVWRFNTYAGDYRVPAQIYRLWMEEAFEPWRLSDTPSWVEDIGFVQIAGVWNLYLDWLPELAKQVDPSKTLLYLVHWRKDGYDRNYPDYTPLEEFEAFLKTVKDLGFRVMLHTNAVGVSTYHPLYEELQQYQFRSSWDNGSLIGWGWHLPDHPDRFAYINPASSKFRNIFVSQLKEIWEKYDIDAFHLDISTVVENDANGLIEGLTAPQGSVLLHQQLVEAMPGVVLSGEGLHEVTFFRESFAQSPIIRRSLGEIPHPISAFLFSPYTKLYGHLGMERARENPQDFQARLNIYQGWGVLPTLKGGDLEQPYHPLAEQVLDNAQQWQEYGLRPDFESDWNMDTLFQYVTNTGETVVYQQTDAGRTFRIQRSPDLNQDGVVNVLDLVIVANSFGTPDGDLNGDGQTNILDLVIVSQHFR